MKQEAKPVKPVQVETKKQVAPEVKRLLSSLSDHGHQHLTEVETDLLQTTVLLSEAIEKLGASFMAIHEAVSTQQAAVDRLLSGEPTEPELIEKLKSMPAEIGQHVNAAVTGLQFQDMTSQLIARTVKRVVGLRDVLASVGNGGSGMQPESDAAELVTVLDGINQALVDQSSNLDGTLWKAVTQTDMGSGDVDLF